MDNLITTISQIADIFDGPHATPEKTDVGPYFLSISSLENGRFDLSKSAHLSEEDFKRWTKRVTPQKGDLLFSYETRLGEAALMPDGIKACLGRRMGLLRPRLDKVIPEYLLYAYLSPKFQQTIVANTITGATVNRIALNELPDFPIRIPDLEKQQRIAKLLQDIDSKIDINRRINKELEAMTKTLYGYWFLQFDFPDSNGAPYKSSGGAMVYNDVVKREIPAGWMVKKIGEYADVTKGDLITAKSAHDGEIKVVAAGIDYSYKHASFNRLENTITISGSGANAGFINFWREPIFASDCITVRGNTDCDTILLLEYLRFIQPYIFSQATGSAQPHVYPSDIKNLDYVLPNSELLKKFGELIISLNKLLANNEKENERLSSLRDWLLPMLMNGQITVS